MVKTVYILHGISDEEEYFSPQYPSASNSHWFPWLQKQLVMLGYNCQTPEVPQLYKGNYKDWFETINHLPIDKESILVGHSAGCGFFLKWLSANDVNIDKLIMVAPWRDIHKEYGEFMQCDLDPDLSARINEIHVFYSLDEDVSGVKEVVNSIRKEYPKTHYHEFEEHGHFCLGDMGTEQFPELLKVIND